LFEKSINKDFQALGDKGEEQVIATQGQD